MNSRQLQYAILLSKTRNFSQVAEKPNISQPALSKQILVLESELDVKLFGRTSIPPLTLTPAGEHFIAEAEALLYKESQLMRSMEQFRSGEAGTLTIGTTPFRSTYLVADVIRKVREKFPGICVHLHEEGGDQVRKDAAEGKFDPAIVNLPVNDSVLDVRPPEADRLVLVVPASLSASLPQKTAVHFEDCKDLPFAVVSSSQEMRQLFNKLCTRADFTPTIVAEAFNLTTVRTLAHAGIAATILPRQFVVHMPHDNITVFDIINAPYTRQPVVATRRDQVMTAAASYAVELQAGESATKSE